MVRPWPPNGPLTADSPWTPRERSGPHVNGPTNFLQQNPNTLEDQRANSQELDEHAMNTRLSDGPQSTGGQSASPEQNSPSTKTRNQPLLSLHGSPKWPELLR
jgi:hypothetical protein